MNTRTRSTLAATIALVAVVALGGVALATPAWVAMSFIVVRRVPWAPTARRAPSSSPARVRAIALPARDRVPATRRGAAEASPGSGGGAGGSCNGSGTGSLLPPLPGAVKRHARYCAAIRPR
jgi:hypothetical protein